jgi:hypothetical protein
MTEFGDRCRELVGFYFRKRTQFPLQPYVEDSCMFGDLHRSIRAGCVDEARLFIRMCRVEEERTEGRQRIFGRDRPYWRYRPWY